MSRATAAFADAMESCAGYVLWRPTITPNQLIYSPRVANTDERPPPPSLQNEGPLIRTGDPVSGGSGAAPSNGESLARSGEEKTACDYREAPANLFFHSIV